MNPPIWMMNAHRVGLAHLVVLTKANRPLVIECNTALALPNAVPAKANSPRCKTCERLARWREAVNPTPHAESSPVSGVARCDGAGGDAMARGNCS